MTADFTNLEDRLIALGRALIDQHQARVIVAPNAAETGFWFGGGNMVQVDGSLYLVGRYRNAGDSRLGVAAGTRGLELAIFRSTDSGATFEKVASWAKAELNVGDTTVLSIEGAALHVGPNGVHLFVSTEKQGVGYPQGFEDFLKPGAGVWSIDRLVAPDVLSLRDAPIQPFLTSADPEHLHIKDPFVYESPAGDVAMLYCSHPYCWSSSNTGYVMVADGAPSQPVHDFFPRGTTWDVAMTRGTAIVDVPNVGLFSDLKARLLFYCGGECVRNLDEHTAAVKRPRGYSCEELGGLAWLPELGFGRPRRLSRHKPLFVSPYGTGCSRYVDVLTTADGMYATWQQSQPDGSQLLVMNFLPNDSIKEILSQP